MTKGSASTTKHKPPVRPAGLRGKPALICAFPSPLAFPLPDSGTVVGRAFFEKHGHHDTEISSAHFKVDRAGGSLRIADVGSRNGTWVNGQRLAPRDLTPVEDGAILRAGGSLFVFRESLLGEADPSPPAHGLVGPYGLRQLARSLDGLTRAGPVTNVLIEGETGTGKELLARAVADSLHRGNPYAVVNVASLARGVFESQLFGHVAGAFSDARTAAPGILLAHDRGTVVFDEIGELDLDLQAKLLRVLENREVLAVGAAKSIHVDVLVVAATHRDLSAMVDAGAFRRDLLARLAMAKLTIPPLRERPEDLFALAAALSMRAGHPLSAEDVEVEAMERLLLAPWPSNVRELDAALTAIRRMDPASGPRLWAVEAILGTTEPQKLALTTATVESTLAKCGGNATLAAAKLGVSRGKLLRFRKSSR